MKYNKLYGPYSSKEDALSKLPIIEGEFNTKITDRYIGLTIGIKNSNRNEDIDEYWFKDGIQNDNLVKKNIEDITELKLNNEQITDTTFTKYSEFNQLFDNGTIKLDKLPNDLRDINTTISNKINDSNELKDIINNSITNSDTLTDIVSNSINNNTIIQGLQDKFNDGKLDTLVSNLTDTDGKFKLPDNVVLDITLESKLPDTIVRRAELPTNLDTVINKFTVENGEVSLGTGIKLPDTVITNDKLNKEGFAKQTDVNTLQGNVNTLQDKFDTDGKLNVNNLTLPDNVITKDKLDNEGFAKQTIVSGLQDKFDTDGKLKVNNLTLPENVVLESTLERNLPDNIKAIRDNFEYNNGKLTIKDNSVLTTTFTKQTDVNGLISEQVSGLLTEGNETFQSAVEKAIGNGEVVNNAINSNVIIQGLQGKFDTDGKLVNTVLPTGLQQFTSKLSNDGKLATLDVLPTGVITETNLDSKLPENVKNLSNNSSKLTNLAGKLDDNGKINSLDILPTTELTDSILTTDNINSKLPQGIKDFTEKLTNDGKLDIKNLVDGTTPITTDTFAKKAELSSLSTEFTNLSTVVITTENIKDNDIVKGLQSKFDSNGKLASLDVLPTGVITETNLDSKLPNTLVHEGTLDTRLASKADSSALNDLQNIAITTNNFNSKIPTGLQKFTGKLDDNGELDITKLKLDGQEINKNTLALSKDIPTAQTLLEDENLISSINDKITHQMQGEEFEGIVNDAISKSDNLQQIVQNGINNSTIIQSLQGKFDSDGKLVNTVLPTGLQELSKNLSSTGKLNSLDILPTGVITETNLDSKLPNTLVHQSTLDTKVTELNNNLANKADASSLSELQQIVITTENISSKLPDTVITKGKLDSEGFAKQTDLNTIEGNLTNLTNIAVTSKNISSKLPNTIAHKTDLTDLVKTSDVDSKITTATSNLATKSSLETLQSDLNTNLAKKADSSDLNSLQKSVGTLNSRTLSNKVGFINIENNNIGQSNLDLIYNSITDARISSDEVTMKLNPMETGYYYFIVNNYNNIITKNAELKKNLDVNESYNFVFIDGTNKNVTEYYYTLSISDIFKNLNFIYKYTDGTTYSQIHLNENVFNVLLDKLKELGLNQQYNYLSELRENIKIIDDGSCRKGVADTKFYDLSLKWSEISQVLKKYNKTEYYLTIKNKDGNLNNDFITEFISDNSNYKAFENSNLITNFIEFINTEITSHDSQFYQYLLSNITNIKTNDLFKCYTLFTFNKNNQIECQDITILRLTIDYLINHCNDIENIMNNYTNYFNEKSLIYFENFYNIYIEYDEDYNTGYGIYLSAFYNTLIKINSSSTNYYVTTKTFDDSLLNMKLSNVLNISLLYQVNSPWDEYINSVKTIKYENINNGSVSQYIVDNDNIIELPYKFKKDSDDELINWLNTYKIKCDSYSTSHDENELIYFGSEYDIDVLLNSYTYHIITDAFTENDEGYELKYLTDDEVKTYINKLSEEEKVKKIFLALIEDNGYQYIFEQYVLNDEVLMTFQEYYIIQYSTSLISQLVNTGGVTVGGKQINFAKSDDVSNLSINSETNMEVVAQLVNGLIEDLTLIAQKVSLTDNEKANLSVIDLTSTTGKLTYDVTTGTYKSPKIEGNTPINPRPVTSL